MGMNLSEEKVLVTGGAGFVGSHLVEQLAGLNSDIFAVDIEIKKKSYFAQKNLHKVCNYSVLDINDYRKLHEYISNHNISVIFHLAAQAIVEVAYQNPLNTLATNIMGTVNVLEAVRTGNTVKAVVVASSDKAYGKLHKERYVESDPLAGDHPYDVSKSAADLIATTYFATYKLPVTVSRFGNIYGEGDPNSSRIIPCILEALATDTTVKLRSNGKSVRDYLHVKDVANGYIELAQNINRVQGQCYNFGSADSYSVLELIALFEKILGRKIPYQVEDTAINEIPYQSLDYSKVNKAVGWKPKHSLANTIEPIYQYYRSSV